MSQRFDIRYAEEAIADLKALRMMYLTQRASWMFSVFCKSQPNLRRRNAREGTELH
jgi:hypothetical protein